MRTLKFKLYEHKQNKHLNLQSLFEPRIPMPLGMGVCQS
ncbi:hypothetical protein NSP_43510 [Nodularia spumigena CCY9414]|nr:hypothetical protein NSP_43510 [Nodularia spumigena CCY9414]